MCQNKCPHRQAARHPRWQKRSGIKSSQSVTTSGRQPARALACSAADTALANVEAPGYEGQGGREEASRPVGIDRCYDGMSWPSCTSCPHCAPPIFAPARRRDISSSPRRPPLLELARGEETEPVEDGPAREHNARHVPAQQNKHNTSSKKRSEFHHQQACCFAPTRVRSAATRSSSTRG